MMTIVTCVEIDELLPIFLVDRDSIPAFNQIVLQTRPEYILKAVNKWGIKVVNS